MITPQTLALPFAAEITLYGSLSKKNLKKYKTAESKLPHLLASSLAAEIILHAMLSLSHLPLPHQGLEGHLPDYQSTVAFYGRGLNIPHGALGMLGAVQGRRDVQADVFAAEHVPALQRKNKDKKYLRRFQAFFKVEQGVSRPDTGKRVAETPAVFQPL
jgi:hypothetical protein